MTWKKINNSAYIVYLFAAALVLFLGRSAEGFLFLAATNVAVAVLVWMFLSKSNEEPLITNLSLFYAGLLFAIISVSGYFTATPGTLGANIGQFFRGLVSEDLNRLLAMIGVIVILFFVGKIQNEVLQTMVAFARFIIGGIFLSIVTDIFAPALTQTATLFTVAFFILELDAVLYSKKPIYFTKFLQCAILLGIAFLCFGSGAGEALFRFLWQGTGYLLILGVLLVSGILCLIFDLNIEKKKTKERSLDVKALGLIAFALLTFFMNLKRDSISMPVQLLAMPVAVLLLHFVSKKGKLYRSIPFTLLFFAAAIPTAIGVGRMLRAGKTLPLVFTAGMLLVYFLIDSIAKGNAAHGKAIRRSYWGIFGMLALAVTQVTTLRTGAFSAVTVKQYVLFAFTAVIWCLLAVMIDSASQSDSIRKGEYAIADKCAAYIPVVLFALTVYLTLWF